MDNGEKNCACKRKKCERHGNCILCIEHHKTKKHPPYCKRDKKQQKKS